MKKLSTITLLVIGYTNTYANCCKEYCCCCCNKNKKNKFKSKKPLKTKKTHDINQIDELVKKQIIARNSDNPHVHWLCPYCWLCGGLTMLNTSKTYKNYFFNPKNIKELEDEKQKNLFLIISSILKQLDKGNIIQMSNEIGDMIVENSLNLKSKSCSLDQFFIELNDLCNSIFDTLYITVKRLDVLTDLEKDNYCTEGIYDINKLFLNIVVPNQLKEIQKQIKESPKCIYLSLNYPNENKDYDADYWNNIKFGELPIELTYNGKKYKLKSFSYVGFNIPYNGWVADLATFSVINANECYYNEMGSSAKMTIEEAANMKLANYQFKWLESMLYEIDE